ncbi:MAG: hypothetical protein KC621_24930 [Myxococcales bacterium]|nr:hypothetical protein [Myxococcales bacterium]
MLFLQQPGPDLVVRNDSAVTLKNGDQLHSQPAADYGGVDQLADAGLATDKVKLHPQPDGWTFLVVDDFDIPVEYGPHRVQLLIKLPPLFPDAAPDMFWVRPAVHVANGTLPRGASHEVLLQQEWQRFSWHLASGAWKPGVSTLRDYLRCVRGRFERRD